MCYITKWHCGSKMCYQWGICVTNVLPLDKISLTIVLKKVVYFADYKHITLPATQRNHLDPILCYHRPHADHILRDRGATVKVVSPFVYEGVVFIWVQMTGLTENERRYAARHTFFCVLSHSINLSLLSDSNQRPRDYKSRALANWAKEALLCSRRLLVVKRLQR